MAEKSFMKSVLKKLVIGIIIGIILVVAAGATHFPPVFQVMFFVYALLGAFVFILLDAPAMKRLEGGKAVMALVVFYLLISGLYIAGATILPQFDPEDEKGKIEKILKARRARTEQGKAEELLARAKVLDERAKAISKQLSSLGAGAQVEVPTQAASSGGGAAAGDLVAKGKEQWDLQE
ncbi:MAG: hypothetical protein R3257_04440, partial [bacterium]|nr:hypothetical protein [bacterium]